MDILEKVKKLQHFGLLAAITGDHIPSEVAWTTENMILLNMEAQTALLTEILQELRRAK